jgi:hypothetical protein
MIAFSDHHREVYGVEPIFMLLPIARSTYHAHAVCRIDAIRLPARAYRDLSLTADIHHVHAANCGVYGVRKVWRQLGREGIGVRGVRRCYTAPPPPGVPLLLGRCWRGASPGKSGRRDVGWLVLLGASIDREDPDLLCAFQMAAP